MAKKKDLPVLPMKQNPVLNGFLVKTSELARVKAELEVVRADVDELVMGIYHAAGLAQKDRPENFTLLADEGTVSAELKKKRKNQPLNEEAVDFLRQNKIKYSVEKTDIDFIINPDLRAFLLEKPCHFHTLSYIKDSNGFPLINRIEQVEVNVAADETIGQIYAWAAEQPDLKTADLTTLINRYSTLAITPVYEGVEKKALYATRYLALEAEGEVYEHYKGGVYRALKHFERDGVTWVEYEHLWPHRHAVYERPLSEFVEFVEPDEGRRMRRFRHARDQEWNK